jgi:endoglucanase
LGNLIVNKKGTGKKIMLAAHMDGVGFMVTHYEKEGVLRFAPVGGLDPASILQAPVRFPNNVYGVISCDDNKLGKELKMTDLFLDIGAKDEDEARKLVQIGDTAVYATSFLKTGNRVMAPYLDNRAGCLVLLEAMKQMKDTENDLSFVFTTQEEVGTRGAQPAAYALEPDYALVVDVTCPDDIPGALHEGTTAVGKGAAIKIMDHSVISSPSVVQKLNQLAQEKNISAQNDVLTCGGTDGGPIHRSRSGVLTGGVSIPCRYTHAPVELIDLNDLEECVRLVCAFCESEL